MKHSKRDDCRIRGATTPEAIASGRNEWCPSRDVRSVANEFHCSTVPRTCLLITTWTAPPRPRLFHSLLGCSLSNSPIVIHDACKHKRPGPWNVPSSAHAWSALLCHANLPGRLVSPCAKSRSTFYLQVTIRTSSSYGKEERKKRLTFVSMINQHDVGILVDEFFPENLF